MADTCVALSYRMSPVAGVPPVFAVSQGGLHDVILDRSFVDKDLAFMRWAPVFLVFPIPPACILRGWRPRIW